MNIKRENIGTLNELITIELLASDYQEQVTKSLKDLKRKANVPGFRAGHVQMGIIEKMYKKAVIAEEVSKITNDEIYKYLSDNKLNILFEPIAREDKTVGDFENTNNFSFSFEIGLCPEFAVNYADAKKVVFYKVIAAEKEIDKEVMDMRRRVGKFSSTEEVVEQDMLLVAVTPEGGGEAFTSSLALNYIKDSELKSFIGKKLNDEMEIDTTRVFKSDYERSTFLKIKTEALENAPKKVHIKIDAIHHMEPAEINDEFFSRVFPDESVKDEITLRNKIKDQIELRHISETNMVFRGKVMEILIEKTAIELPDAFIKKYLVKNKQNYTAETVEEQYADIKKSIVYQLVEQQISKDCNIQVEQDEVMQYLGDYVRQSYFGTTAILDEETEKQVANFVLQMEKNKENVNNAYENIFYDKMTEGLKIKLEPKLKELVFEDLISELSDKKEKKPKTTAKKEEKEEQPKADEEKPKVAKTRAKKKAE